MAATTFRIGSSGATAKYVKVKSKILIVNPMTKKIVDIFPQARG